MKMNKTVIIGVVVVILLLLAAGGYYVLSSNKSTSQDTAEDTQEQTIATLTPQDIGLSITPRADKKAAKITIAKASDIVSVEYQISYTKEDAEDGEVPEGLIGEMSNDKGASTIETDYRDFGTCSSGTCRYDKVVSDVELTLKITKKDGKAYQVKDTLKLQ